MLDLRRNKKLVDPKYVLPLPSHIQDFMSFLSRPRRYVHYKDLSVRRLGSSIASSTASLDDDGNSSVVSGATSFSSRRRKQSVSGGAASLSAPQFEAVDAGSVVTMEVS